MSPAQIDLSGLVSGTRYASGGYPHETWKQLRDQSPVHWVECPGLLPFWAITRHADITEVSRNPELFLNAPRLTVGSGRDADLPVRMLLNMDRPEHHTYRRLVSPEFTPRSLRGLGDRVDQIANAILDSVPEEGEIDFVAEVSAKLPIWVIADMLGIPKSDWGLLFDWTNRTVGAADEEFTATGMSPVQTMNTAGSEMFAYFEQLAEERRKEPREDLATALVQARIEGEPMPRYELLSYFFLLVVAGNETTRNATTGGLLALLENPSQLERARRDPELNKPLVEEVLRWTSPVAHFCRTAARDVELNGQKIRAGESLTLFYPSANRDDRVFEAPDEFRIDRRPNRHIAFGVGEHVCLGAHVARLELQVIFRRLLQRLASAELSGPVERLRSPVIGGIKHMPLRYRLTASGATRSP